MKYFTSRPLRFSSVLSMLGALVFTASLRVDAAPFTATSFSYDKAKQGAFVTAATQDQSGRLFVATEDNGVWMRNAAGAWTQFTMSNSTIGDDTFYALAVDKQNRVWAGSLRNGVSVFDGKTWKNYGLDSGLLGERVLDIAISPTDGDVWISTSLGLTRYRIKSDSWISITRANGLPSDQIQSLAFDPKGTLYAATQCDGLAINDAKINSAKWRRVSGPLRPDTVPFAKAVNAPLGLPSPLTNKVLVMQNGAIYVATTCGLARSKDDGATWDYVRGRDWADKVRGRANGLPYARWQPKDGATLSEDYVTALAEDAAGNLWVGHRRTGYEVFDTKTDARIYGGEKDTSQTDADYVTGFLVTRSHRVLVTFYGSGAKTSDFIVATETALTSQTTVAATAKFPTAAPTPSFAEIEAQLSNIRKLKTPLATGAGVYEGEDWRTQGDWLGRYGRQYALLCAARSPLDHIIYKDNAYDIQGEIGPHHIRDDSLRHWVGQENAGDNPRVLYNPIAGYRREASWDDHAEIWDMSNEGPDVWAHILIPEGLHRISAYFYNQDGHSGSNRWRDYLLELKRDAPSTTKAEKLPNLATARVLGFSQGSVYQSFIVRGPSIYWLKIGKNNSFNTTIESIMIDKLVGTHTVFDDQSLAWMGRFRYEMPDPWAPRKPDGATAATTPNAASSTGFDDKGAQLLQKARLWEFWLDGAYGVDGGTLRSQKLRLMILRALNDPKSGASPELVARWRWKARVWNDADRKTWRAAMQEGREAMLTLNPQVRGVEF